MKKAYIAVLGYGTVGSGVVETFLTNSKAISARTGFCVEIKRILDLREFDDEYVNARLTHDFEDILNDKDIEVVAEVMGGTQPAYEFTKKLLSKGKSVVTSNKELVASHGAELLKVAEKNNCSYLFEASVGGGIPIIRPINEALTADVITEISGILNGTTNYILTKMSEDNMEFCDALIQAQELGYAEKDPTNDVEGHDACRKIAILSSLATGRQVRFEDIPTIGITKVNKDDISYAKKAGYVIKLLAFAKMNDDTLYARVAPVFVNIRHPLATVNQAFNAIYVKGNIVDETMFYGRGAGKLPTASAISADIIAALRSKNRHLPCLWSEEVHEVSSTGELKSKYYVRFSTDSDKAKAIAEVEAVFGNVEVIDIECRCAVGVITEQMKENDFLKAIDKFNNIKVENYLRIAFS